jgi:AbiU2
MTRRDDELLERWRDQLAKIEQELYRGHLHQEVWTEVRDEIQRRRPDADATFLVSYSEGYVASQLVRVRRLTDTDRQSHSLASLIQRIAVNPRTITRARWINRYVAAFDDSEERRHLEGVAANIWHERWADPDNHDQISPTVLQGDLDQLATELEHITTWATKTIAHLDPRRPERVPKYHEIRDALTLLARVAVRYQSLLNRPISAEWVPIIQGDWQAVLRPALFPLTPEVFRHVRSFT